MYNIYIFKINVTVCAANSSALISFSETPYVSYSQSIYANNQHCKAERLTRSASTTKLPTSGPE